MDRKRILIAPNSFKECADSVTIAELIKQFLSDIKDAELLIRPVSDGGDGFLTVCKFYFDGEFKRYNIRTAYDDSRFDCPVLYCRQRREIYIESAEVLGLKIVPRPFRNPLKLSSKGLGDLLLKINKDVGEGIINIHKAFIGIGGTATIDMGMGMMSELGVNLYDSADRILDVIPVNFAKVSRIDSSPLTFPFEIIPVVDVENPLLGEESGIQVYGKQKGANEKMIFQLIKGFNHLLNLIKNNKLSHFTKSLSGAGGGILAALQIFYRSSHLSSKQFLEKNLGFNNFLDKTDYLITGEGAYDQQSGFGKGASTLLNIFLPRVNKIFLICGNISETTISELPEKVYPIDVSRFFKDSSESIEKYELGLKLACDRIKSELNF